VFSHTPGASPLRITSRRFMILSLLRLGRYHGMVEAFTGKL
jgi:hypothetical protein